MWECFDGEFMPFGKYEGQSISDITEMDPGYALWAIATLDDEEIVGAFEECIAELKAKRPRGWHDTSP